MSDTKYNFDDYIFDNVLEDTYLAIKDVRENIDGWAKRTHEIDLDYNPYEGRDEREKLDMVITKNIVNSIKDRLHNVDFENKVMRGVNVEAVRSVVGRDDYGFDILSSAFGNLADHIHEAKQVAEDLSYDVGAPKHFDDCIQYLKEQTEEFVLSDKACERIGGKQFDMPQKKRLDLSQFYGENKYSDGTDIELGD